MKDKELNLCEILKDCPKGTKLYSPIFGEVDFISIDYSDDAIIVAYTNIDNEEKWARFQMNGIYIDSEYGEIMLFPSKGNRDWNTWKNPKPKKERFDPKTLKPFDKVLVKHNYEGERWVCNLFSDILPNGEIHCIGVDVYECIPYNDDTKHLVGTTNDAPEYYRYWE